MLILPESLLQRWQGQDVFKHIFALEGKIYKQKENRKTFAFSLDGRNYFAKLHRGVGWKEIIKNLMQLRLPVLGAQNEWRAIQRLQRLGIETTTLVGYGKKGWNPARLQSFVITEALTNTVSLENLCRNWSTAPPPPSLKRSLITKIAGIARTLHENGMNHRDLYICHFLLDISAGEENIDFSQMKLYLIDLHRVQIRGRTPHRWRVKDLASLYFSSMDIGLTQRDLLRFIRAYRNKPLRTILPEDKVLWRQVTKRAKALYRDFSKSRISNLQ